MADEKAIMVVGQWMGEWSRSFYAPGSTVMQGNCGHQVILSPPAVDFLATNAKMITICQDCIEGYKKLHPDEDIPDGPTKPSQMVPGSLEGMKEHLGEEEANRIIDAAQEELERRMGMKVNTGRESAVENQAPDDRCYKCSECNEALVWEPSMSAYVGEEGMPMCYPPGQPLGNLGHKPEAL